MHLTALFFALALDRLVGDPDWLWRRFPHPVVAFGKAIGLVDDRFNREDDAPAMRRHKGMLAIAGLVALALVIGLVLSALFRHLGLVGFVFEVAIVAILIAQKSLSDHVGAVGAALRAGGLPAGREAVSMIVGRDPEGLDRPAVLRAAIESLAENFSDGVVAPAFWYAVGGLPGLLAYKMINTADSMIGHLSPRHRDFGRAAAKLDDLANWPAARLSAALVAGGALIVSGTKAGRAAAGAALRDAGLHRSPNAGWPEAAMAGALGLSLGGPRSYGGAAVSAPRLNAAGRRDADLRDLDRALAIYRQGCNFLMAITLGGIFVGLA
mgnify:CR=1 FL=1|jgi:cobalamin biosynthesis protein CobD